MKKTKLTDNARQMIGCAIEIKWGTSRGRDTYGYMTASLYHAGRKMAACNGGGYDMRGTVVGNWVASTFKDELLKLKEKNMPKHSHWQPDHSRVCDGKCRDGKTVQDGRSFYGLTFHDPNYDPSKALIGKDCSDRTLGDAEKAWKGKTVAEAEKAGVSFGLERYQAIYMASSKHATKRHTIPSIDGACGFSEVIKILNAIGLNLKQICDRKNLDIYEIVEFVPSKY